MVAMGLVVRIPMFPCCLERVLWVANLAVTELMDMETMRAYWGLVVSCRLVIWQASHRDTYLNTAGYI